MSRASGSCGVAGGGEVILICSVVLVYLRAEVVLVRLCLLLNYSYLNVSGMPSFVSLNMKSTHTLHNHASVLQSTFHKHFASA